MKKIAAFFDIDGTVYRDSLLIEHFKKLIKYDVVTENDWIFNVKQAFDDWDTRNGDYDRYLEKLCAEYCKCIKGLDKETVDFTANQVIKTKANRVYRFTRNKIKWHLSQGHMIIFVSGSPHFLVEKMAKKYKADFFAASQYECIDEKYTGKVTPMWDHQHKQKAILKLANQFDIDLEKSYAYGDTNGDKSMFEMVGNGYAINPSKELLNYIQNQDLLSKKVKIIVERKDVIYYLPANVEFNREEKDD